MTESQATPHAFTFVPCGRGAQRIAIIGKTNSGKSTLAAHLAQGAPRCVWVDPKRDNDPGWPIVGAAGFVAEDSTSARAAHLAGVLAEHPRVTVQLGDYKHVGDPAVQIDAIAEAAFEHGNLLLALDDVLAVLETKPPLYVRQCSSMGRSRGLGLAFMSQRAHGIPRILLTQSEHVIAFQLFDEDDAARLKREAAPELAAASDLGPHEFIWLDRSGAVPTTVRRFPPLRIADA